MGSCPHCDKTFWRYRLETHTKNCPATICSYCNQNLGNKSSLEMHISTYHPKLRCLWGNPECTSRFDHTSYLQIHILEHFSSIIPDHGERMKCGWKGCGSATYSRVGLSTHAWSHCGKEEKERNKSIPVGGPGSSCGSLSRGRP